MIITLLLSCGLVYRKVLISSNKNMTANHQAGVLVPEKGWAGASIFRKLSPVSVHGTVVEETLREGFLLIGCYD